jgi:hypothetical protein
MSTVPIRVLLVVVFSGLYLALAVAARGGIDVFFAEPALVGLTVVLVALCGAALAAGGNLSPGVREDRGNRCLGTRWQWLVRRAGRDIAEGEAASLAQAQHAAEQAAGRCVLALPHGRARILEIARETIADLGRAPRAARRVK